MSSVVMNSFKSEMLSGSQSFETDTYYVALVGSTIATSSDSEIKAVDNWSELSATHEVTGTGYVAGGQELSGVTVVESDPNNWARMDADDVTWASSTITARGAVIYRYTDGALVAFVDFGEDKSSLNGDFVISWSSTGILVIS